MSVEADVSASVQGIPFGRCQLIHESEADGGVTLPPHNAWCHARATGLGGPGCERQLCVFGEHTAILTVARPLRGHCGGFTTFTS